MSSGPELIQLRMTQEGATAPTRIALLSLMRSSFPNCAARFAVQPTPKSKAQSHTRGAPLPLPRCFLGTVPGISLRQSPDRFPTLRDSITTWAQPARFFLNCVMFSFVGWQDRYQLEPVSKMGETTQLAKSKITAGAETTPPRRGRFALVFQAFLRHG